MDSEAGGELLGLLSGMATGPIQHQEHWAAWVGSAQDAEEFHEVLLTATPGCCHHAPAGARVDGAPECPLGILTGNGHQGLLAHRGPYRPQGRKPAQHRAVHDEQHRTRMLSLESLQTADKAPFFCPRWGAAVAY